MSVNKVLYGNSILLDLSEDTVTAGNLLSGVTAHNSDGETITGTMPDNGAVSGIISTVNGSYTIPAGYHNGAGAVTIDNTEQAKIIPANIIKDISILGVTGTAKYVTLTPVTPTGINQTHFWLPTNWGKLYNSFTYENKTNTRSDEYPVEAGKSYVARFIPPYGAKCDTCLAMSSMVGATETITNVIRVAPTHMEGFFFFTAPVNCYFVMYKDDTGNDSFLTECYEVTYHS